MKGLGDGENPEDFAYDCGFKDGEDGNKPHTSWKISGHSQKLILIYNDGYTDGMQHRIAKDLAKLGAVEVN